MNDLKKKKILAVSPTLTGGSWVCVEELIKFLIPKYDVLAVGLGEGREVRNAKVIKIPYFLFDKMNPKYGGNIFFNAFYQLPLQIVTIFQIIFYRPNLVLSNGFTPLLLSLPLLKLMRIPVFVYYGSYLDELMKSKIYYYIFKTFDFLTDFVFVNSIGSKEGLSPVINKNKILVIEHWTDMEPYSEEERKYLRKKFNLSENDFVVLYVGRLMKEKGVTKLLKIIRDHKPITGCNFWFVGSGILLDEIKALELERQDTFYKGFFVDRNSLRELYTVADLLWTFADETYVAKPGVESLALGTPLMIPNTAAIMEKFAKNIKVKDDLIPKEVGWVVNDDDSDGVWKLLESIYYEKLVNKDFRSNCTNYAHKNHSIENVKAGVKVIESFVNNGIWIV